MAKLAIALLLATRDALILFALVTLVYVFCLPVFLIMEFTDGFKRYMNGER